MFWCYHIARHLGELKFKQKGREEQCEPDNPTQAKKVMVMIIVNFSYDNPTQANIGLPAHSRIVDNGNDID